MNFAMKETLNTHPPTDALLTTSYFFSKILGLRE